MKKIQLITLALAILAMSCGQKKEGENGSGTPPKEPTTAENAPTEPALTKLWESDSLLTTSESIIYDTDKDILYVSCINGQPLDKDGNGFIAQVDLTGKIINQKWITGLDAPKGMGIKDGKLYVTNISELVEIDIQKGEITNRYTVEGSSFLNDITIDDQKTIWFSDSNTGKIHLLTNGQITTWTQDIQGPNGLLLRDGNLYVTTMGSHQLLAINLQTKETTAIAAGLGGGDGLMDDLLGGYIASDWSGRVFHITADGKVHELLNTTESKTNSADIWYIADQKLVLVPTFFKNTIAAYRLSI